MNELPTLENLGAKEKFLYIMRGVPCSGKSFRAFELVEGNKNNIFSADKWFSPNDDPEEYRANWSREKLSVAHNWCKNTLAQAMQQGTTPVVVDNTNIKLWEFAGYIDMAKQYKYTYIVEESKSPWWTEIRGLLADPNANAVALDQWAKKLSEGFDYNGIVIKNVHGVPQETILKMLMSFQPYEHV